MYVWERKRGIEREKRKRGEREERETEWERESQQIHTSIKITAEKWIQKS
jgi:hypothetical protein